MSKISARKREIVQQKEQQGEQLHHFYDDPLADVALISNDGMVLKHYSNLLRKNRSVRQLTCMRRSLGSYRLQELKDQWFLQRSIHPSRLPGREHFGTLKRGPAFPTPA